MNNFSSETSLGETATCTQIVFTLLTAVISFVSISALFGNILVTATFLMNATLRTSTNYFIMNMAVSDLLSSSTNLPLYATEGTLSGKHLMADSVATVLCKLVLYVRCVSQAVSVLSLVWIVVERFIAIVYPFKAVMLTRRLRVVLLIITWIIPLLIGFPYICFSNIVKEGRQRYCRFLWGKKELYVYFTTGFVALYCAPLISIIILYCRIMKCLARSRLTCTTDVAREDMRIRNRQQNMNVMKVFISIVTVYFLCWTPLCVFILLIMFFPSLYSKDSCLLFAGLFFYVFPSLHTAINAVILFVSSTNFNNAAKELFGHFKSKLCCKFRRVLRQNEIYELNQQNYTP